MRLEIALVSLVCTAALMGCASTPAPPGQVAGRVSICEIRANPEKYVGRVVTVSGDYKTDSTHYSFVSDSSCQSGSSLDLGFAVPERDTSVDAFERAKFAQCERRGQRGLCVISATVVLRGEIARTIGADHQPKLVHLIINPHSVLSYQFADGR